jgi:uncharacterized glyoxalase superfamily protein PhnB
MDQSFKPSGYSSVSPYIMAADAQRVIDFMTSTFGAATTQRFDRPDGSVQHAEVKVDDSVVMISDATNEFPAFPVWLHVYVPDVDAAYVRALEAGGVSVEEPKFDEEASDRRAGVKDPSGNMWYLATHMAETVQQEQQ